MRMVDGLKRLGIGAAVVMAISACGGAPAPQPQSWSGTTSFGGSEYALQVEVGVDRSAWVGTYTIGSSPPFTGEVVAELVDGVLSGQLVATARCTFDLVGSVSADALEATFTPSDCPGGSSGTWSAAPSAAAGAR